MSCARSIDMVLSPRSGDIECDDHVDMVKLEKLAAKHRKRQLRTHIGSGESVWIEWHKHPSQLDEEHIDVFKFEMNSGSEFSTLRAQLEAKLQTSLQLSGTKHRATGWPHHTPAGCPEFVWKAEPQDEDTFMDLNMHFAAPSHHYTAEEAEEEAEEAEAAVEEEAEEEAEEEQPWYMLWFGWWCCACFFPKRKWDIQRRLEDVELRSEAA